MPDGSRQADNFGVDHYKPRSLFEHLSSHYDNLFYACNTCNRRKGDYWPSPDDLEAKRFVANPCDHRMADHLRFRGIEVQYRSAVGQFMVDTLLLNDTDSLALRRMTEAAIRTMERDIDDTRQLLQDLDTHFKGLSGQRLSLVETEKASANARLLLLTSDLARLGVHRP
jgi:hypothetical protein